MTEAQLIQGLEEGKANHGLVFQDFSESLELCKLLIKRKIERVLEIGAGACSTLLWQFLLSGNGKLVTVDINTYYYDLILHLVNPQIVTLLLGDSQKQETVERVAEIFPRGTVDFLFIDGEHAYNFVKSDFENYRPFVKLGGLIVLHDTLMEGPYKVLSEAQDAGIPAYSFGQACGMGVIFNYGGEIK